MKKWFSILLAVLLVLSFAACGGKNKKPDNGPSGSPAPDNEAQIGENSETAAGDPLETDLPSGGEEGSVTDVTDPAQETDDPAADHDSDEAAAEDDPSEDAEDDEEFTGLDSEEETSIGLEENQGAGSF